MSEQEDINYCYDDNYIKIRSYICIKEILYIIIYYVVLIFLLIYCVLQIIFLRLRLAWNYEEV